MLLRYRYSASCVTRSSVGGHRSTARPRQSATRPAGRRPPRHFHSSSCLPHETAQWTRPQLLARRSRPCTSASILSLSLGGPVATDSASDCMRRRRSEGGPALDYTARPLFMRPIQADWRMPGPACRERPAAGGRLGPVLAARCCPSPLGVRPSAILLMRIGAAQEWGALSAWVDTVIDDERGKTPSENTRCIVYKKRFFH